jgi:hypothetical protein
MADFTLESLLADESSAIMQSVDVSRQAVDLANTKIEDTKKQNSISANILAGSGTIQQTQQRLVDNSATFASIMEEMDVANMQQQTQVQRISGLEVTDAQVAEQYNAPARENYLREANDPVIDANMARAQSQIDIYSRQLVTLQNDTSVFGHMKRMALEGATRDNLAQARTDLTSAQSRKINATNVLSASLKGNLMFSQSSTAVERAVMADSLTRVKSSMALLESKGTITAANRQTLGDQLQLDKTRLDTFLQQHELLKEHNSATNATMAGIQTRLYALQTWENAVKKGKDHLSNQRHQAGWQEFLTDSAADPATAAKLIKDFPDVFQPEVLNSKLGMAYWKATGLRGTRAELGENALAKRSLGTPLNDEEYTALRIIDSGVVRQRDAIIADAAAKMQSNPRMAESISAERDASLKALANPTTQAEMYEKGLAVIKHNASNAISTGAVLVPDWNNALTDPTMPFSKNISEQFKSILTSDEFASIKLGMPVGADPAVSVKSTVEGTTDYLYNQWKLAAPFQAVAGKSLPQSAEVSKLVTTTSQGLADYYKSVVQMNNRSNAGLGSNILPTIVLPSVGINGASMDLTNASHWEQALRLSLSKKNSPKFNMSIFSADPSRLPIGAKN